MRAVKLVSLMEAIRSTGEVTAKYHKCIWRRIA